MTRIGRLFVCSLALAVPPSGTDHLSVAARDTTIAIAWDQWGGSFGVFAAKRKAGQPSLVYCGDDPKAKKVAVALIRDVGFDPVDAGPLRIARYTEPFALLVAQLAYETKGGPEVAYRFQRYKKSKR